VKIKIIAAGTKMPAWVNEGFNEYQKRLTQEVTIQLVETSIAKRGKNPDIKRLIEKEGKDLLQQHAPQDLLVTLDVKGKHLSTEQLAEKLSQWQHAGRNVSMLVGGPDGLSTECSDQSEFKWSLSALTLPHPLVRILLAEQIYRAWTITKGHPYHK
jgi:23S rRNA (pseudouridine1915-N3)-methyltransferase